MRITLLADEQDDVEVTAVATSKCARDADAERAEMAKATGTTETAIITLPALQIYLVDEQDNLSVGDVVTYEMSVLNQGSGPAENVEVTLELPEELKFVSMEGRGEANADGQSINLDPIETLKPGQRVTWKVKAEALKIGDLVTKAELNSDYLDEPVKASEPTRVIE